MLLLIIETDCSFMPKKHLSIYLSYNEMILKRLGTYWKPL